MLLSRIIFFHIVFVRYHPPDTLCLTTQGTTSFQFYLPLALQTFKHPRWSMSQSPLLFFCPPLTYLMHISHPQVIDATKHMDVVFHCATAAPTGANALNNGLMYSVNVEGTRNVIEACIANSVSKLVRCLSYFVYLKLPPCVNWDGTCSIVKVCNSNRASKLVYCFSHFVYPSYQHV